jgi:hypothetical protein
MLVSGGRCPRTWAGAASILVGLAWLPTLACGGRTSALERDAYDPDQDPYAGSSSGGSSSKPAPKAGNSSVPSAGSSAGGSVSGGLAGSICENYCKGYAPKCAARLEGRECVSTCAQEMTGFGARCQELGVTALKCLTPFFERSNLSCDAAVGQALAACGKQVEAFNDCKGNSSNPQPAPQPAPQPNPPKPQPMPTPTPPPTPAMCGAMGLGTVDYCYSTYACPEGVYSTTCKLSMPNGYDCTCSYPGGFGQGFTLVGDYPPCDVADEVCGFTF